MNSNPIEKYFLSTSYPLIDWCVLVRLIPTSPFQGLNHQKDLVGNCEAVNNQSLHRGICCKWQVFCQPTQVRNSARSSGMTHSCQKNTFSGSAIWLQSISISERYKKYLGTTTCLQSLSIPIWQRNKKYLGRAIWLKSISIPMWERYKKYGVSLKLNTGYFGILEYHASHNIASNIWTHNLSVSGSKPYH